MKKLIIFENAEDLVIFKDSESDSNFYCITYEVLEEKRKITEKFGNREADVPDEFKIKVCPFEYVMPMDNYTDIYRPIKSELIDFPINRFEGTWLRKIKS